MKGVPVTIEYPPYEQAVFDRVNDQLARLAAMKAVLYGHAMESVVDPMRDEIIRSLVVFMHAALEEIIREYSMLNYRRWTPEKLRDVPLPNSKKQRAEKFTMADLVPYRESSVDDLLLVGCHNYLNAISFTSTTDIASHLQQFGLEPPPPELLSRLAPMIERRHRIVHHNDLIPEDRSLPRLPVAKEDLDDWMKATNDFLFAMLAAYLDANYIKTQPKERMQSKLKE